MNKVSNTRPLTHMTDVVMGKFPFAAVAKVYQDMNWGWSSTGMRPPTAFDVRVMAQELLIAVEIRLQGFEHDQVDNYHFVSTGGLMALGTYSKAEGMRLDLYFVPHEAGTSFGKGV